MRHPERVWHVWLLSLFGSLAGIETYALKTGKIPTLSAVLCQLLGVNPRRRWGRFALTALSSGCTLLIIHLVIDVIAAVEEQIITDQHP